MDSRRRNPSIFSLLWLLSTFTIFRCVGSANNDPLLVQTSKGAVKGATLKALDKEVDAFLGIPYAKPPLGELRFRPPQPADPWSGVLYATKPPNTCIQASLKWFEELETTEEFLPNSPLSEDCLTLNVWVPRPRPIGTAVMVWIHGGGFMSGSPNFPAYDPRILCAEERVIVVSIAYRITALGFLYLGTQDAPGNAGLFDQRMALEWIRDNIRSFGGDPDKITLFGQSVGAASVCYHLLSPLSSDLFARGIVLSGSIPTPWLPRDNSVVFNNGLTLAERLQCPHDPNDMDAVLACLLAKDPFEITTTEKGIPHGFLNFAFLPVVDGTLVPEPVGDILTSMRFKKKDILIGLTSEDAFVYATPFLPDYFNLTQEVRLTRQQFKDSVKRLTPALGDLVHEAIFYEYTDWDDPENPVTNRDAVGEYTTDSYMVCPTTEFSRKYAEVGSGVYVYVFAHVPSINSFPDWMGSVHGHELPFLFGNALNPTLGFDEDEKMFSRRFMRYWANFARTGNPNQGPNGSVEPIVWPLFTTNDQKYLTLSAKSKEVGKDYKARRCAFWQEYIPKLKRHASKSTEKCTTPDEDGFSTSTLLQGVVGIFVIFIIYLKLW